LAQSRHATTLRNVASSRRRKASDKPRSCDQNRQADDKSLIVSAVTAPFAPSQIALMRKIATATGWKLRALILGTAQSAPYRDKDTGKAGSCRQACVEKADAGICAAPPLLTGFSAGRNQA